MGLLALLIFGVAAFVFGGTIYAVVADEHPNMSKGAKIVFVILALILGMTMFGPK